MPDHRVVFDFEVEFANGGELQAQDFRLDIDAHDIEDRALGDLLVADLGLLMVSAVRIRNKRIIEEAHKRVGRALVRADAPVGSDGSAGSAAPARPTYIDLSHPIRDGMVTYPGLPAPTIGAHLTREASRERYAPGTEFFIGTISMVANTGTYLDVPFHRFPDGLDLVHLPASACADVPGVVVRPGDVRVIDVDVLADVEVRGRAVLFHSGWDRHFGTPAYAVEAPFLTEAAARRLVDGRAVLVGIDSLNIDSTDDPRRPVHTALLAAGVPIIEHMTGLDQLPDDGFAVTALAPRIEGLGSFPVRVVARITG